MNAINLEVDASDIAHAVFRVRQSFGHCSPLPSSLALPKWLPAYHAPRGPIDFLAGLRFESEGKVVAWRRDASDPYVFHLDKDAIGSSLVARFDRVTPTESAQGRVIVTEDMLRLQWEGLCLYPHKAHASDIEITPRLRLPAGWEWACALEQADIEDEWIRFASTDLRTLINSPLLAGRSTRRISLDERIHLFLTADRNDQLPVASAPIDAHRRLVAEADALFGHRPFGEYTFLMSLSDQLSRSGLEHRASSECGVRATYFSDWNRSTTEHDLLPHEYVHAWVGKYRVPKGNFDHDFASMTDELMWVYEGLTQFYGHVLAARCGLISAEHTRQAFALIFATYDTHRGRDWRPLVDTDMDPIFTAREPQPWRSWQRSEDYYSEGLLIWLEVDMRIRILSDGKRSLDNFARAFFGPPSGGEERPASRPYDRTDVMEALQSVQPYDWADFFAERVDRIAPRAPYEGIELGGYELVWRDRPSDWLAHDQHHHAYFDFSYSLGFKVGSGAKLIDVLWEGPAYRAGMVRGMTIVAVGERAYSHAALQDAIDEAARTGGKIALTVMRFDHVREVEIDWQGGQLYPDIQPKEGQPQLLDTLLAARAKKEGPGHV